MLSDKTHLLEQINIAINKKWHKGTSDLTDLADLKKNYAELIEKHYLTHCKSAEPIEVLEQRIEGLERRNDQLLCFINFLLENLPELVNSILHSDPEAKNTTNCPAGIKALVQPSPELEVIHKKIEPCPTRREMDVLDLLVKGFCAKEIATRLFISETTVITHKKNLKQKFSAKNTVELISKTQPYLTSPSVTEIPAP